MNKKKKITIYIVVAVIIIGVIAGVLFFRPVEEKSTAEATGFTSTRMSIAKIKIGTITNSISGNGESSIAEIDSVKMPVSGAINELFVNYGSQIEQGTPLFSYDTEKLENDLAELNEQISALKNKSYSTSGKKEIQYVKATFEGRLKLFAAKKDTLTRDILKSNDQIAVISTAGTMYLDIKSDALKIDDIVTVKIGKATEKGKVVSIENSTARIEISKDYYSVNAKAVVLDDSKKEIGMGTLSLSEYITIEAPEGEITLLYAWNNKKVYFGEKLFAIETPNSELREIYDEIEKLKSEIFQIEYFIENPIVLSENDGIVLEIKARVGETLDKGEEIVIVNPMSAFEVVIKVDEKNLDKVSLGQEATITSNNGTKIEGIVTHINYNAKYESGSNMFDIHIQAIDYKNLLSENILPFHNVYVIFRLL